MKKFLGCAFLGMLATVAADAAPSYIQRTGAGAYNVTYDYMDKAKSGWYVGGHLSLNMMNWENEYSTDAPDAKANGLTDDSYNEFLFGGGVSVGYSFDAFWRAEFEGGLLGQFEDEESGTTFKMTVPYAMVNGYYDFLNGLYVGAGAGIALPKTELQGRDFVGGDNEERAVSPIVGVMLGYSHKLDYNLTLDVRYRLAGFMGTEHERVFNYIVDFKDYDIKNKIGLVLDNSISIGLRYNF